MPLSRDEIDAVGERLDAPFNAVKMTLDLLTESTKFCEAVKLWADGGDVAQYGTGE